MLKPWFQKINYEAVEGPELTWNLTAHSLVSRSGHSHVWCKQRGSYSGLMRTLMESCTLCVFSLRPRPCSLIPQASLFQCFSLLTPILHLPLEKRPSQANSRDKDFPPSHLFPERYRKRGSLQRLRPTTRWGDGKRGYKQSLKHCGSSSQFFLLFLCSFSISFTISMGFGDCIEMMVIEVPVAN